MGTHERCGEPLEQLGEERFVDDVKQRHGSALAAVIARGSGRVLQLRKVVFRSFCALPVFAPYRRYPGEQVIKHVT